MPTAGRQAAVRTLAVLVAVALLVLLGVLLLFFARPAPAFSAADRDAIRKVLEEQDAAWNAGKLEEFMAGYWHSPDLTFFSGDEPRHGWDATLERYRKRYQAPGAEMGKLTFSDLEIDGLGPDTALVRGRWRLQMSKGEPPQGLFTLIMKKLPEGWRIIHDHTSAWVPPPDAKGPEKKGQ
jgi:beta-aspartyl-peptidase (threonine type)